MKKLILIALTIALIPMAAAAQEKNPDAQKAELYLTQANLNGRILVITNIIDSLYKDKIKLEDIKAQIEQKLEDLNKPEKPTSDTNIQE